MEKIDLIKPDTLKDLLFKKFEDAPPLHEEVDPLSNGDFEVIKQLLAAVPDAVRAKEKMDKIIDKCGNPPRGVGIQNLRTCIAETKWKFDVSPEERQGAFKVMIINFIERYFYLICFAIYARQFGPEGFKKTFVEFMNENSSLRDLVQNGKDKLEWSRKVDQNAVNQIQSLITAGDIKEKLGEVVTKLYKISHTTYSDMPRGVIKVNIINNSEPEKCIGF